MCELSKDSTQLTVPSMRLPDMMTVILFLKIYTDCMLIVEHSELVP